MFCFVREGTPAPTQRLPAAGAGWAGLTLAMLHWIFTNWTNSQLTADGVNLASAVPNDDGDGIKEWSDLSSACDEVPINAYGPGSDSGTFDFFAEKTLCTDCFGLKAGKVPEDFQWCSSNALHTLEQVNGTDVEALQNYMQTQRPLNCYMSSESDYQLVQWLSSDAGDFCLKPSERRFLLWSFMEPTTKSQNVCFPPHAKYIERSNVWFLPQRWASGFMCHSKAMESTLLRQWFHQWFPVRLEPLTETTHAGFRKLVAAPAIHGSDGPSSIPCWNRWNPCCNSTPSDARNDARWRRWHWLLRLQLLQPIRLAPDGRARRQRPGEWSAGHQGCQGGLAWGGSRMRIRSRPSQYLVWGGVNSPDILCLGLAY